MNDSLTRSEGSSGASGQSGANLAPNPDAKPVIEVLLGSALELLILTYVLFAKELAAQIFESMENPDVRARWYSSCTGLVESLVHKFVPDPGRQAADVCVAIDTDDSIAERFIKSVGIPYIVANVKLETIYQLVMSQEVEIETEPVDGGEAESVRLLWFLDSSRDSHRIIAARLSDALVANDAFNSSKSRTYERILKALTPDVLFGDTVPAELRVKMFNAINTKLKRNMTFRAGEIMLNKDEGGASFEELSKHIDVAIMIEPFVHYATELGFADAKDAKSEAPPPLSPEEQAAVDALEKDPNLEERTLDADGDQPGASKPPPIPKRKEDEPDGDTPAS